jgi:hypothetical protein
VYFDLIGLPPTAEEIAQFRKDDSPDAYEKVVDRLLASPHYGERWGRHWLDLVRYAETQGHEFDYEIPDAWRYRDYVVRAFNEDLPFDQFLTEHVAGDLLAKPRRNPADGTNESLVATGFWWLGEAKHSPVDSRAEYADKIDNQIDVFGKAVLGLTVACARCHDHKFDAISTKDYYSLFSVLASSRYNRADIDDPAPTVKLLDELKQIRGERAKDLPLPKSDWREKATAFELFGDGWRSRWDACGLALRAEGEPGFPHSGREVRKLEGSLRSPTFRIEQRYLAIRVAGRETRARLILNGLQLIKEPIYGGLEKSINHGEEFRWLVFDLASRCPSPFPLWRARSHRRGERPRCATARALTNESSSVEVTRSWETSRRAGSWRPSARMRSRRREAGGSNWRIVSSIPTIRWLRGCWSTASGSIISARESSVRRTTSAFRVSHRRILSYSTGWRASS